MLSSDPSRRWSEDFSIYRCERVGDFFSDAWGCSRTAVLLLRCRWFGTRLGGGLSKREWDDLARTSRLSRWENEYVYIFRWHRGTNQDATAPRISSSYLSVSVAFHRETSSKCLVSRVTGH